MGDFRATIRATALAVQAHIPVLLLGEPGVGKTAITDALFSALADVHETVITAVREPADLGGFPVPGPDGVELQSPKWVHKLAVVPKGRIAGLFLDELSSAPPATRAAAMRGILDRTFGETHIPALSTVAAMNPPEIAESGYDLSAPLANRFLHLDWKMPGQYWLEQMIAGFPAPAIPRLPEGWREKWTPRARAYVAAFGSVRPTSLQNMPAEAAARSGPWPSFRTWTMAIEVLAAALSMGEALDGDTASLLVSGCVGTNAALEFLTYAHALDLPDPEELLKHPEKLVLPQRGDRAYAILVGVVSAVLAKNTLSRWMAGWKVLEAAIRQNVPDLAVGAARALAGNRPDGLGTDVPVALSAFIPMMQKAGIMLIPNTNV